MNGFSLVTSDLLTYVLGHGCIQDMLIYMIYYAIQNVAPQQRYDMSFPICMINGIRFFAISSEEKLSNYRGLIW